jgi:hypothetical protein
MSNDQLAAKFHFYLGTVFIIMATIAWPSNSGYRNYTLSCLCIVLCAWHGLRALWLMLRLAGEPPKI